ncbi:uncharacterized protein [Dysidea avara]|uniref:uncharacterized protein isoform X2 n=1 Tax=Dysidea avara TaxID=196820 RepID=UPI00332AC598
MNMDTRGVVTLGKPADQIVDANSVNEICTKYSVMWRQIGLKLGLDASVLDNVEADYHEQRKRFEVTLRKWMKLAGDNATWDLLELAITNANREDLSLEALSELPRQPGMQTSASVQSKLGEQLQPSSANPLEFTADQEMFIAFEVLTETFLEEFRRYPSKKIADVSRWCSNYCRKFGIKNSFRVSSMDDVFQNIYDLPCHNFLNPGLLKFLASLSKNECLVKSVKNYESTFSPVKLKELTKSVGAMIQKIQVYKENEHCSELVTKLQKKDVTVGELHGFTAKLQNNILALHTGAILPQCIEEGCVCIRWIIPSCLVDYAYHSACLNTKMFSELNLLRVTIGRYTVEAPNDSVSKNPIQIFCDHYQYLLEAMDPNKIFKTMFAKMLLSNSDQDILSLHIPINYMKNSFILEHIRTLDVSKLFMFIEALQKVDSQKHICDTLLKDLNSHGFSVVQKVSKFVKPQPQDYSGTCLVEYDEKELEIFKISKNTRKQLLPSRCTIVEKFSPSNLILHYLDMIDTLSDCLQSVNHKKILKTFASIMCSDIYGIKYFSADVIKRLQECSNTTSLLRVLFTYTNWYDHSIIRELVEACDCPEGVKLLDEFDSRIDDTQPITAYPIPAPSDIMVPDVSSTHTVMGVWCEQPLSSLTLKHIGVVKSLMMNKISITKHACILLAVDDDKFAIFYWLIPRNIESLIRNAVGLSSYLYENGLLEVVIYPTFSSSSTSKEVKSFQLIHRSDEIPTKAAVSKADKTIDMSLLRDTFPTVLKMPAAEFPNRRGRRRWRPHLSQTAGVSKLPFLSGLMPFTDYTSFFDSSSTDDELESIFKDRMVKSTTPLTAPYSEVALQKSTDEHALLESDIISVKEFAETGDVGTAFLKLQTKLTYLLKKAKFFVIRRACIAQQKTPSGVQLPEQLKEKILSAQNIDDLLDALVESPYWNWIDLRLLQAIVVASDLPSTLQLLENYKMAIFTRKLIDVLPNFPSKAVKEEYFCKLVSKLDKEPDTVTVADLLAFQSQMERVIMDIVAGVCVLGHLDRGCIEVHWYIPTHYVKSAHQSAFARCYLFIKMHLLWMQVGYYPKIHNPLASPKIVIPALQTLNSAAEMTNLINYRHDGIHVNIIPVVKKLYIQLLHEEMAVTVPINANHNGSPVDYHSQVVDVKCLELFYEVIKTCGSYKTNGELLLNDKCSPEFCALVKSYRSLALW